MNPSDGCFLIDGDTAYVVAEGEHCPKCHSTGELIMPWPDLTRPPCDHPYCAGPGRLSPPAWMTATCHHLETQRTFPPASQIRSCVDCIDGKPIHTVEVEHLCFHEGQRLLRKDVCDCGTDDGIIASYRLVVREVRQIEPMPEPYGPGYPPAAKPGMHLAICEVIR